MGKAGRFACIFIPMALTIGSLISLIFVFEGNREPHNDTTNKLYFYRADLTGLTSNSKVGLLGIANGQSDLVDTLLSGDRAGKLADIYQVGLWNYCSGDKDNKTGAVTLTFCSKPQASYSFDLEKVWGLDVDEAANNKLIPGSLKDALSAYKKVSHWMFIAFVVAIATTAAEILVGFFAIFSRWGSCVTSLVSAASTFFTIAAAVTATVLSSLVAGALDSDLHRYGVDASVGTRMLAVAWLAAAFSIAAGLFWTFSTCCCSGSSGYKRDGGIRRQGTIVEQGRYTHEYKPLDDPLPGGAPQRAAHAGPTPQQSVAMHNMSGGAAADYYNSSGAYEPYRTV